MIVLADCRFKEAAEAVILVVKTFQLQWMVPGLIIVVLGLWAWSMYVKSRYGKK